MASPTFAAPQARLAAATIFTKTPAGSEVDPLSNPPSSSSEAFSDAPFTPSASSSSSSYSSPSSTPEPRDPHLLPKFTPSSLARPSSPVLYLPPLLSSLPPTYPHVEPPTERPPLHTETRLPNIDPASLSLHKALHHFHPRHGYAALPYGEAFNWNELELPEDEEREWYVVAFRSRRKEGSDGSPLYEADRLAHEEAVMNGGLIMYWYGVPDPTTGLNLATCVWQSRMHAVAANSRPHHIKAMRLAAASYEVYTLERHVLRKEKGSKRVTVEEFTGGEVGW
ncbi:hypothetical protein M407DRAFT_68952 [Tulasnella calospora MUT 4182]|uniref:Uncharacterized protein n=1 Tax=Tulasnella calospora MUT 4182 TaxID=1051891 RepID=A0A0C3L9V5_9AGAM|nr:hypothetical protein M407DRAFT_68952 [Tulasnella calospora MUT 4182]